MWASSINTTSSAKANATIVCSSSVPFRNIPCVIVQVQRTISLVLGLLCNHALCLHLDQDVQVVQNQWYANPVEMLQLHEDQHSQELLCRRSILLLVISSQYLMILSNSLADNTFLFFVGAYFRCLFSFLTWSFNTSAYRSCGIVHCWRSMLI